MKDFPLPVRMVGPGSQPDEDEALQCLEMPRGMNTFEMPRVPESASATATTIARDALAGFLASLGQWNPADGRPGPRLDLTGLAPPALDVVNQVLGEGEVAIRVRGTPAFRIQESVFTGLWRVCTLDGDGRLAADWLEAAPLPIAAIEAAHNAAAAQLPVVDVPAGAMNSPALLAEIAGQMATRRPGAAAHVINLTLLPMAPDDHVVLAAALPVGPVAIISRGFGNCRISSTGARNVWRVQYFNNMNTLILDTIEVVTMPEVALAAAEDLEDSRVRLAELIEWMSESASDAPAE